MKKISALFVSISMLCSLLAGCVGNNEPKQSNGSPNAGNEEEMDSPSSIDKQKTEENFWGLVHKMPQGSGRISDGVIYYTGYDCKTEAYNLVINLISPPDDRLEFDKSSAYESDIVRVQYLEGSESVFFKLKIKFYERTGQPEYTVVFKAKD